MWRLLIYFPIRSWLKGLTLFILIGCDEPAENRVLKKSGLVYCGALQPKSLNPQLEDGGIHADALSNQLFDRLVKLNPKTYSPEPFLATSWEISPDGKEYTFSLKPEVAFHTTANFKPTRPLHPDDVVFSFERIINKTHPYHKVGGGNYPSFEGFHFDKLVEKIEALDDNRVRFTLSQPDSSFLSTLATPYAVIHSKEYAEQLQKDKQEELLDKAPVGTGPFRLDKEVPHRFIRLKRHPDYWQGQANIEQVVLDTSHRGSNNLTKLFTKECDVLASPLASQISVIQDNPDFTLTANSGMNLAFLLLNTKHNALSKPQVRHAISLAINRGAIIKTAYHGAGSPASSLLPPSFNEYKPFSPLAYDPNLAIALLKNAGYRHGLSIDLVVPETPRQYNPSPRKTADILKKQLAHVGIHVNIIIENNINRDLLRLRKDELEMVLTGWIADNGDPDTFLRPHLSCNATQSGWNLSNWCNPRFDNLLDAGIATSEPDKRKEIYTYVQSILLKEMPVIPLVYGIQYHANINNLQGLTFSPFGDVSFYQVSRDP